MQVVEQLGPFEGYPDLASEPIKLLGLLARKGFDAPVLEACSAKVEGFVGCAPIRPLLATSSEHYS